VLKDDEAVIALLPDLVNSADVRVIKSGCDFGLSQQTLLGALIGRDFCWEEFNGDFPLQPLVLSQVDLAHAAAPEFLDDAVMRDGLADHWSRILRPRNGQVNESWAVWPDLRG
jgi:hypothetical protein